MKKKFSKLLLITVVTVSCFYFLSEKENNASTLLFNNIEALASGEGGTRYRCYGSGDIECYGHRVEYMIDGLDLD